MVLTGTIINGVCIIVGSLLGLVFTNVPEKYKETVMHGIALVVILIGLQMAFTTDLVIVVLLSLLSGALLGEWLEIEKRLNDFGDWISRRFTTKNHQISISQGLVTATLIFAIGAMAILGALDSGLRGDHQVLITKGILDGFVALVLTTSLGIGVMFSAIPVMLYQGTIALLATYIDTWLPDTILYGLINEITAVGGLLIVAIGLNMLNIVRIRIGNLLPSILTVVVIYGVYIFFM